MRRWICLLIVLFLVTPVKAEVLKWVDFNIPYESLKYAMDIDIATFDKEKHIYYFLSILLIYALSILIYSILFLVLVIYVFSLSFFCFGQTS